MNNDEFRSEMHSYVDYMYDSFLEKRETLVELLKVFNDICKKNDIQYYVCFGSLIGLVRDKGLIPWDRDIDVCIKIKDADRLCEALKKDLPEDYYYKSIFEDPNYSLYLSRIYKKGYDSAAFNLDIYYVFGGPDDEAECSALSKKIKKLHYARHGKSKKVRREDYKSKYSYLFAKLKRVQYIFTSYKSTYRKYMKYVNMYDMDKSKYVILLNDTHAIPKEAFDSALTINAEGNDWPIPCGYDAILTADYKDYMKYYPIKDRFEEMILGYKVLNGEKDKK